MVKLPRSILPYHRKSQAALQEAENLHIYEWGMDD